MILHDNGCSDESFATLLRAIIKQNRLKCLHYSVNDFSGKAVEAINELLDTQPPNHLRSLAICRPKYRMATEKRMVQVGSKMVTERLGLQAMLTEGLLNTDSL